jgi:DNA repair and recombination protein RAD54B
MRDKLGAVLADHMGLGKTVQVISLLCALRQQIPAARTVVIVPASVIRHWEAEFEKWWPDDAQELPELVVDQKGIERPRLSAAKRWFAEGGVYLLSLATFAKVCSEPEAPGPASASRRRLRGDEDGERVRAAISSRLLQADLVIVDEAHRLSNSSTRLARAAARFTTPLRVALTGYPMQNRIAEYYSMVNWVLPGFLGSWRQFRVLVQRPIAIGMRDDASPAARRHGRQQLQTLQRLVSPVVLRRDSSLLAAALPPVYETTLYLRLTRTQRDMYTSFLRALEAYEGSANLTTVEAGDTNASVLVHRNTLLYIANAPAVVRATATRRAEAGNDAVAHIPLAHWFVGPGTVEPPSIADRWAESGKTSVLHTILTRTAADGKATVVFSQSLATIDVLERLCVDSGWTVARLDGSVPLGRRAALVSQLNSEENPYQVILVSTRAGGIGLSLVGASVAVLFDVSWNPVHDIQALCRLSRFGQTDSVQLYRLISEGTVEQRVYELQLLKEQLARAVVDDVEATLGIRADLDRRYFVLDPPTDGPPLHGSVGRSGPVGDCELCGTLTVDGVAGLPLVARILHHNSLFVSVTDTDDEPSPSLSHSSSQPVGAVSPKEALREAVEHAGVQERGREEAEVGGGEGEAAAPHVAPGAVHVTREDLAWAFAPVKYEREGERERERE